jgi:drug/metabolite transporter (DMT)-like permease
VMGVSAVQFVVGSVVLAVVALIKEGIPANPSSLAWGSLVYLGIVSTFMPVALYYWLLQHVTVTYSTITGYIIPFVSVVVGWALLHESIGWGIVAGGILILAGVVVTDLVRTRQARSRGPAG